MIDPLRHLDEFNPTEFGDRRVDVIGCGATGSAVVFQLAKLGVQNIHAWDFDTVEAHNLANQMFRVSDVGKPKVQAMAEVIEEFAGTKITPHIETVTKDTPLGEIVFLLTDTMKSRKEIAGGLYYNGTTDLVIETRLDPRFVNVFTFNPNLPLDIEEWEKTLYDDDNSHESACGAKTTVGATAGILAGWATWQMILWSKAQRGGEDEVHSKIAMCLTPPMFT